MKMTKVSQKVSQHEDDEGLSEGLSAWKMTKVSQKVSQHEDDEGISEGLPA